MSRLVAQTNSVDNGASKATDFQPPTANPQDIPTQNLSDTTNVQSPGSDVNLQNQVTRIITPNNPAATPKSITEAKNSNGVTVALVLLVVGLVILGLHIKRALKKAVPEVQPLSANLPIQQAKTTQPKPVKKQAPKKSKSKRKKRARRG